MAESYLNEQKTLWEKEQLLVTSNFSFSHSVFKKIELQTHKNEGLFRKGFMLSLDTLAKSNEYTGLVIFNFNPLPDDNILDWSKLKQIADDI